MRRLLIGVLALGACGEKVKTLSAEGEAARRAVLASTTERVILPLYRAFEERAGALVTATEAWSTAEVVSPDAADSEREAARSAWAAAMDTWQEAELLLLGPAAPMASAAGGMDLRDRIYSWPVTNPCRVDQETVKGAYTDDAALALAPANVRGLDALEQVLFAAGTGNACPPQTALNAEGTWAALGDEGVRKGRAAHAVALAKDLRASAEALRAAWEPSGGNFARELAEAGLTPTYRSAQEGLNALSDAMFYLEKEGKDMKLAIPLGLRDCATEVCPEATESPLSRRSREHLVHNAKAFRRLYLGGPEDGSGTGFDDLLRGMGATSLADTMQTRIDAAITALEAIPGPLEDVLTSERDRVQAAYDRLRELSELLKSELLTVLDLELPERAEGDND